MTKARDLANVEAKATLTDTQTLTNKTLTSPVLGGTTTTASGNLAVQPATYVLEVKGGGSTEGAVQLNCAVNSHGQTIKSQPHAQAASNTLLLPGGTTIGNSNAVLVSDTGTQTLTNKTISAGVLTGTLTAGGGVGTNGQVLQSTATGIQWATASSGGMTLISETTANALSSLSLSSIPQTYKQLMLVWEGIFLSASQPLFALRFNNDSTSSPYALGISLVYGTDKTLVYTNNFSDAFYSDNYFSIFGYDVNLSTEYHRHAKGSMIIDNYASTSKFKHYSANWHWYFPGYSAGQRDWNVNGRGTYKSTTAITSIDFSPTIAGTFSNAANTSIRLYGIS